MSGHYGKTLLDAIREGIVANPPLMGWNAWQRWRSTEGLRPTTRVDGQGNSTTSAQELQFWKAAMAELYGSDGLCNSPKAMNRKAKKGCRTTTRNNKNMGGIPRPGR